MSEQSALLIKAVRKRPYLFDTTHEYYKNILKKAEAWDEIASELNLSSDMAKVKWKNLRDSYIRHKKSVQNGKGQDKKYVKWPWSNQMMFLDNCCLRGKTLNPRTTGVRAVKRSVIMPPMGSIPEHKQLKIPLAKEETRAESTHDLQDEDISLVDEDEVEHLFLSYAKTFKKLRPATQAAVKIQLAKLFSRAELNELQDKGVPPPKVSRSTSNSSSSEGSAFLKKDNGNASKNNTANAP